MTQDTHIHENGLEAPIDSPASRVVSLVPAITESLFDLQLGDRLVGITQECIYPAAGVQALAQVGSMRAPDFDQIKALLPDLIFADVELTPPSLVEKLRESGLPVWVTFAHTVQDVFNRLWNIMYVFEETEMVPRIRLIEYTHNWVEGISEQRTVSGKVCRVFAPISKDPLITVAADTYVHDLLRVCGGLNVFAQTLGEKSHDLVNGEFVSQYPIVTMDDVVAAQPDVVLLPGNPGPFTEADVQVYAGLDIPAAKNKAIHLIDGTLLQWAGIRIAYTLNQLPDLVCPEL